MYLVSMGSCYTVLDFNNLNRPERMWAVRPDLITPVRDKPEDYISGYLYQRGTEKIRLQIPEVIAVRHPNLANPLFGSGVAQAIKQPLAIEGYADAMREKLFHNDATPGLMFLFEESLGKEQDKEIVDRWNEQHQGWRNIRKPGFLFGKVNVKELTMPFKDMDLTNQDKARGRKILQVMGVPPIIAGDTEDLNRATSEAALYVFGNFTIDPILTQFREAFNEQLIPLYPQSNNLWLELDFDTSVPKDKAALQTAADSTLRNMGCTLNEYRQMLDLPPVDEGNVYFVPANITVVPAEQLADYVPPAPAVPIGLNYHPKMLGEAMPARESKGKMGMDEASKEAHWTQWVEKLARPERRMARALSEMFDRQRDYAMTRLSMSATVDDILDREAAQADIKGIADAFLPGVLSSAVQDAEALVGRRQRRVPPPVPVSGMTLQEWLRKRSSWLVEGITEETQAALGEALAEGFAAGEGMDLIGDRLLALERSVLDKFSYFDEVRADRIARTEIMTASNVGHMETYRQLDVERVEFFVGIDERTCEDCYAEQGEYDIDSVEVPPLHPNCRCTLLPVLEGVPD
jgi:HK97 family phage portal protein